MNENGILTVSAIDKATQNKGNLVITNDKGRLTKQEIEEMILSADKHKKKDILLKGKLVSYAAMEHYLYALKKIIDAKRALNQNEKNQLQQAKTSKKEKNQDLNYSLKKKKVKRVRVKRKRKTERKATG